MRAKQLTHLMHETYAAHAILINLGFEPEEIFVGTPNVLNGDPPGTYASIFVRRAGLQFVFNFAPLSNETECAEYLAAFFRFAEAQPSMDRAELDRIMRRSDIWKRKVSLVEALVLKGFELPGVQN